ncbi:MAG: hypothetical protein M1833_004240 [Piccolia ochrophora]|nr:MAG: hypothetical protein M1833_004240 [Piccolia ochrophora]
MDFWSRLIGGVGASPSSRKSTANDPQQRLAHFKQIDNHLLQIWRGSKTISNPSTHESVRASIQRLNSVLHEESRSPTENVCLTFALLSQIYIRVSQLALRCHEDGVIREAVSTFSILLDSEEEEFSTNEHFARTLMEFVDQVAGVNALTTTADTESEIVELLFGIAAKIRLQPEVLPIWFTPKENENRNHFDSENLLDRPSFEGVANKQDFPLFYLLIDYVHHEARVGDFARTGLLYIIESASNSSELERWIVDSDLATLMASGLGALYSQLSRKLIITYQNMELPPILALSDYSRAPALEAENSTSPEFVTHLDTFLSYLVFWQDVLEHCRSSEVRQTLLDHFQILFLQQLLYPSLLESSDIDGGSSVAVLTYLQRILDCLDHPELIHLILHYLLALPEQTGATPLQSPASPNAARRRRTLDVLNEQTNGEDRPNPDLYNLIDLIITSLQSKNPQTVTATLKLVSVLLRKHHHYAVSTILRTRSVAKKPERTVGAHTEELELFFTLAEEVGGNDGADETYQDHLKDNLNLLECHPCTATYLASKSRMPATRFDTGQISGARQRQMYPHSIWLDDPVFKHLCGLLGTFLTNAVETNLSLTEVVIDLASCSYMRLDGWFTVDPKYYEYRNDEDDSDDELSLTRQLADLVPTSTRPEEEGEILQIRALKKAQRLPSWSAEHNPPLIAELLSVVKQLHFYRREIPNFDSHLSARKQAFQVTEELNDALESIPMPHKDQTKPSATPISVPTPLGAQKVPKLESISPRMFTRRIQSSLSRSTSPRGRQDPSTPSRPPKQLSGTPPLLIGSPTPSSTDSPRRAFSPSPRRDTPRSSTPPPLHPSFASTDANELRRKVGIPREFRTPSLPHSSVPAVEDTPSSSASSVRSASPQRSAEVKCEEVSVSHLITNVVVLQEFIWELAALLQVRAGLFEDIRFV